MYRPALSYAMISLILLAQVGVPMHLHYCKGMLESVSIYISGKCDDHRGPITKKACCKSESKSACSREDNTCCDDVVTMLVRENSSISPSFPKWVDFQAASSVIVPQPEGKEATISSGIIEQIVSDSGPPLYLLHLSLIYYA